ncbi:Dual specificity tyrosine-phosphorylation-regulated kinase 2 [Orchesella cincta]|uniref:dual-specificity kinase n=1 Tax=Orchesella cincta TaxID=48709 RepID=A0A1D2MEC5_ORCCI|nr:Dual specificity tyrosine-phosphorylation-regulated kinase 2 [Orchesella cincta]
MAEGLSEKMDVSLEVEEAVEQPSPSEVESVKSGMTPQEAYEKYQFDLSSFETSEIFKYPEIYFVGENATKISGGRSLSDTSIFDDENGFYRFVPEDHLAYRYELVKPLGKGTTAQVFSAVDHKENRSVAIKVMKSQPDIINKPSQRLKCWNGSTNSAKSKTLTLCKCMTILSLEITFASYLNSFLKAFGTLLMKQGNRVSLFIAFKSLRPPSSKFLMLLEKQDNAWRLEDR